MGDGPQTFLGGGDEAIEGAGLTHNGRDLACRFGQQANFVIAEFSGFFGLHDKNAAIDERDAQEGVVHLFPGFLEVLEAGVVAGVYDGDGHYLFCHHAGKAFAERHAQGANASGVQAYGGGQDQVRAIGLQQIGGAHIGREPGGDQGDQVHEGVG